ncbi:unnamed protein product [Pylaiella littoralis]
MEVDDDDDLIMMKGPDGIVRPLKDRVRTLCKQRRIRLQEFFKPFDVHNNKKVTKGQFRRALDQARLTVPGEGAPPSDLLTTKEVEVLSKRYEVKRRNGKGGVGGGGVNYGKLCEQVEKVFTRRGLEKTPTLDVKLALEDRPRSGYGVCRPGLSEEEAGLVAGLLGRVRLFAATEGLIVKTMFETFDKRHSGRVTAPIFLRQLDSIFRGRLSKEEARLLLRAYQTRDGDVSYRAMHADCTDNDSSDGAGGGVGAAGVAARGATDAVPVSLPAASSFDDQLQQQQQQQQRKNLAELNGAVTGEGGPASLSPNGRVSQASVEAEGEEDDDSASINSSVTGFPARGTVGFAVGEEWGSGSPCPKGGTSERCGGAWRRTRGGGLGGAGTDGGAVAAPPPPKDSLPIERQMASKVVYHRLMPEDAYLPYDPTRSGAVTGPVFRRGLSDAFRMTFTDAKLDALAQRYRQSENKVSYLRLCDQVYAIADNSVVGFGRQHQHQQSQHRDRNQKEGGSAVEESESERETANKAVESIRSRLRRRRLSIQPGFQEFDRKGEGHVSVGQLERVLCSYGVLPADRRTKELLANRYAATDDPRHPTGAFIAYRHLLEDLGEGARGSPGGCLAIGHREGGGGDPRFKGGGGSGDDWGRDDGCGGVSSSVGGSCGSTSVAASRVFGKPTGLSRPAHSVVSEVNMTSSVVLGRDRDRELGELLAQLKAYTFRSRLRTLEFFRCDDPMRSGAISRERFGRGLLSRGFKCSPVELETICDAYPDPNLADKGGAPYVRYGRLVEEVEGVFGVRELERHPECDVNASVKAAQAFFTSNSAPGSPPEACPLSPGDEQIVMDTLREIGAEVYRRRLNLVPPLRDFDRFNKGVVSGTMFERALSSVGLTLVRRKAGLLRRRFAERFSSPDSRRDVNYVAFLAAVEMAAAGHDKIPDDLLVRGHANSEHHHTLPSAGAGDGVSKSGGGGGGGGDGGGGVLRVASLQDVVREVARQLAEGWADITDFLSDADRLKQGEISFPKLKVALALAGVLLTTEELRVLQSGFRGDRSGDMVDWRRLAVAVNKIRGGTPTATAWNGEEFDPSAAAASSGFRSKNKQQRQPGNSARSPPPADAPPLPRASSPAPSVLSSPLRSTSLPTQQQQQQQQQNRQAQPQQHRRATNSILQGTSNNGSSSGSASNNSDTINRSTPRHLVGAVSHQNGAPSGSSIGGSGGGGGRPETGTRGEVRGAEEEAWDAVDAEVLNRSLEAVRHRVKHYRVHLKPSFQDFDPNRKKKITRQQFLSVLGNMNLNLTEREQDAICRSYTVHERSPGVRVRYAAFCDDIDPDLGKAVAAKGAAY